MHSRAAAVTERAAGERPPPAVLGPTRTRLSRRLEFTGKTAPQTAAAASSALKILHWMLHAFSSWNCLWTRLLQAWDRCWRGSIFGLSVMRNSREFFAESIWARHLVCTLQSTHSCGNARNPLSKDPAFSCIDFNQMQPHQGDASVIVSAIVSYDPHYPKPSSQQ